jgi:hypothetical protein
MFSVITNINNKKTKVPTLFTATGIQRGHVAIMGRTVYVPPLPRNLADLKTQIIATVKNIDAPMLTGVWQEIEYRIDVCRVTRGAHIEHF